MNSKRVFYLMIAAIALISILGLGGIYSGNKILQKQSDTLVDLKLEDELLEAQQVALSQAIKDLEKYSTLADIARTIVPQDKDQARTVREIVGYAAESRISIQAISFPSSSLGAARATVPAPADGAAPATPAAPSITQVKPVEGITGVYQMELTVSSEPNRPVTYDQLISFLKKLEKNRRTAQVTGLTITPSNDNRRFLTFSLTINVYIKP